VKLNISIGKEYISTGHQFLFPSPIFFTAFPPETLAQAW